MKQPIAWIIEPMKTDSPPYLTLNPEVAEKRRSKGDIVTEYVSQKPTTQNPEDDDL
jgi:hypothetical protein